MVESRRDNALVHAFAAMHAGDVLRPYQYSPRELAASEVEITITHCGICHSDLHLIDTDWGVSSYPLVPGHEIVGTIAHAGSETAALRPVALLEGQKSIGGSAVGSNAEIRAMCQFSAQHAITPRTEAFAMREVNEALDRLRQNHARYRAVLINDS